MKSLALTESCPADWKHHEIISSEHIKFYKYVAIKYICNDYDPRVGNGWENWIWPIIISLINLEIKL